MKVYVMLQSATSAPQTVAAANNDCIAALKDILYN